MPTKPNRRTALKSIGATLSLASLGGANLIRDRDVMKFGIIADLHGGLATDAEARLDAFLAAMETEELDAIMQLGDFAFPNQKYQVFADKFNAAHEQRVHVIGNHEFDFGLRREDCFKAWGIESAYYRKDIGGIRVLVLDGNETGSPTYSGGYPSYIGKEQQAWLSDELASADRPVLIVSHQPLAGNSAIDNALEVQKRLSQHADKILLCLNGHSHVDLLVNVGGVSYLHVNSASYYWVGGKKRMAYYRDPLFTSLTLDPARSMLTVQGNYSEWKSGDSPRESDYFDRENAPPETIVCPTIRERQLVGCRQDPKQARFKVVPFAAKSDRTQPSLKVMTWNIWGKLNQDPRYTIDQKTARQRVVEILKRSDADVIAMIETYGSAADIATALGFHHYTPSKDANLCIFSRYPLSNVGPLEGLSSFSFIGATVNLPNEQQVRIYDIWLTSSGRHIVEIKDAKRSDKEFCAGDDVRMKGLSDFLGHRDVVDHLANVENVPVVVAGDFNCVSHLDHFAGPQQSGLNHSRVLPIKVSKAMHKAGFDDTYRQANPDIRPGTLGHTWTTVGQGFVYKSELGFVPVKENPEPEYRDPYARIDFIYSAGPGLSIRSSKVIRHHRSSSARSFPEFPSDHAAVVTEFQLRKKS